MNTTKRTARIDYTVEIPRRGAIRKTVEVSATAEKLSASLERRLAKLSDVGVFNVVVRYEVQP